MGQLGYVCRNGMSERIEKDETIVKDGAAGILVQMGRSERIVESEKIVKDGAAGVFECKQEVRED